MKVGVFNYGWWREACKAAGIPYASLPVAYHPSGNLYAADPGARCASGQRTLTALREAEVDVLIDLGGAGLGFVADRGQDNGLSLVHELAGKSLASHFIDPVSTSFQGLSWELIWPCLTSPSWLKAVWDRAQAVELQQFGIPGVVHFPMAAPDGAHDPTPVDPKTCDPVVSFVGGQNTNYFRADSTVTTGSLLAGTLAHAVRNDLAGVSFHDVYYDLYALGEPVAPDDPLEVQAHKTASYFHAKLFYHCALSIRNRDRFVLFLKRRLGERFRLRGAGWDTAYDLTAEPPIATFPEYLRHFRRTAINLNLVNGNAETGLNMRHFEITAAGGFMLCYDQPELVECFEPGRECAVFHDERDLLEKVRHYLAYPQERADIALAGQRRTLGEHLYSHRLEKLLRLVRAVSAGASAATTPSGG